MVLTYVCLSANKKTFAIVVCVCVPAGNTFTLVAEKWGRPVQKNGLVALEYRKGSRQTGPKKFELVALKMGKAGPKKKNGGPRPGQKSGLVALG